MKYQIYISLLLLTFFSFTSEAKNIDQQKIDVKCHVELHGGKQVIYLAYIKEKKLAGLDKSLINRKILTAGSNEKMTVYKVFECKRSEDQFASSKANKLLTEQGM